MNPLDARTGQPLPPSLENTPINQLISKADSPVGSRVLDCLEEQASLMERERPLSQINSNPSAAEWLSNSKNAGFMLKVDNVFNIENGQTSAQKVENRRAMQDFLREALVGKESILYELWLNTELGIITTELDLQQPGIDMFTKAGMVSTLGALKAMRKIAEKILPDRISTKYGSLTFGTRNQILFFGDRQEEARTLEAFMRDKHRFAPTATQEDHKVFPVAA
jgi:hypothetical protein